MAVEINDSLLLQSLKDKTIINDNITLAYYYQGLGDILMKTIEMYAIPVICVPGIIGNILSFVVFTRKSLYNNSCSFFLAARSLSDSGFLATLLLIWASSTFGMNLNKIVGVCQTLIYLTYVFACLSVWLVVLITAENYIRICKPMLVAKYCSVANAKGASGLVLLAVLIFYNFPFWALSQECMPYRNRYDFVQGMIYTDFTLTLLIPSIAMTTLLSAVVITTVKSSRRRQRLSSGSINGRENPITKMTKMLFVVTFIFFFLNVPSHAVRLKLTIQLYLHQETDVSTLDYIAQSISLLLYYISLSINVVVYYKNGSRFRAVFREVILRKRRTNMRRPQHIKDISPASRATFKTSVTESTSFDILRSPPSNEVGDKDVFQPLCTVEITRTKVTSK